jgi:hypothetical protein
MSRCHDCDVNAASYEATLDWTFTPVMLLCDDCAIWERESDSVLTIKTFDRSQKGSARAEREDVPK